MKKIASFILTAGALIVAASCAKELNVADPTPDNGKEINITVIATEKPAVDEGTKTFIDGTSVKWSDSGEKLKVFEVATPSEGEAVTTQATTSDGVTSDGGATMSFGVSMADKSGDSYDSFDYYAVYPSSAYQTGSAVTAIALNTKGAQTPTATNFDATQDLLIAKKVENGSSQASTLEMQFARVVAIGKMTIKNLETTDPITKITFSAKVGSEAVALAGRTNFNLETATPVTDYASNTQDYSIILDYEGQNITANTSAGMVAYFTCYPFAINATTPGSFKVVVETATESFEKEVNVSSAKGLAFNVGKASVFSVDMDGIAGETKAVDLRYAYLDYDDYTTAGGTGSYANITVDKTHGDSWVTFVATSNGAIGLGNASGSSANAKASYIKLPDFEQTINSVVITLHSVPASTTSILLHTSNSGTSGDIASTSSTSDLVYTFDLSSSSVNTAYLRSNGAQLLIDKIEVYAGTDTRTVLNAPANVNASLNVDANNAIDVSWDAVDGAGSYLISLMDENTDITTKVAATSPYTVTGLEHEMEYLISVKAIPSDPYVNKESAETDAPSSVTTGAGSTDYSTIETSNVTLTAGTNGSSATVDGQTAIKVGTSSKGGSMIVTVPANTTKLHVHAAAWNGVTGLSLNITGATVSPSSIALTADSGISNNSPFTLSGDPEDYYFELTLSDVTAETEITFTSSSAKRFVVWGVNAESVVDNRADVTLSFATPAFEFVVNSTEYNAFTPQTASADPNVAAITSAITYALSDPNGVVTGFSTTTGAFTLTGNTGTATITASYDGDTDNYKPAEDVSYTVKVTSGGTDYTTLETSNVTLTAGTNGSSASVNGEDAIKVGTSSKGGDMTVTVPSGTTKLHVHAAAWKGVSGLSLSISGATCSPDSISLTADDGISGNSPFTLSGSPEDFYFEIALSNITEETTITFTTSTTKRFVIWGVNAE